MNEIQNTTADRLQMNDLVIDVKTISELMASTGVVIPDYMTNIAAVLTADMVLASIFVKDLPPGSDMKIAFEALCSADDSRILFSLPELKQALMKEMVPSEPGDNKEMNARWDFYVDFFSFDGTGS